MKKLNCWEYKKCGREPGGAKAKELGICPAAMKIEASGINNGKYAGRSCWAIAGSFSEGQPKCSCAAKLNTCLECDFFSYVQEQQGQNFLSSKSRILWCML